MIVNIDNNISTVLVKKTAVHTTTHTQLCSSTQCTPVRIMKSNGAHEILKFEILVFTWQWHTLTEEMLNDQVLSKIFFLNVLVKVRHLIPC